MTDTRLAAIRERNEQPADPGPCRVCGAVLVMAASVPGGGVRRHQLDHGTGWVRYQELTDGS